MVVVLSRVKCELLIKTYQYDFSSELWLNALDQLEHRNDGTGVKTGLFSSIKTVS